MSSFDLCFPTPFTATPPTPTPIQVRLQQRLVLFYGEAGFDDLEKGENCDSRPSLQSHCRAANRHHNSQFLIPDRFMASMETLAMNFLTPDVLASADFCNSILSRFSTSEQEDHRHMCAVIGTISQEIKEQNLPSTPTAYFGAISSSLSRLSSELSPSPHIVDALVTLLSLVLPQIPEATLKNRREFLSDLLLKVLRLNSASDGTLASGLKCVSLLLFRDGGHWENDVEPLYGALLGFIADSRQKVRRQTHVSIRDVLQRFQGKAVLSPLSDGITKTLERFLLLIGGSKAGTEDSKVGAQQVLHLLDALKDCLPLMSMKSATAILKYYETLLGLRQPVVTRRITDSLYTLCMHPTMDVSAEVLLKLLCLRASVSEISVDSITITARLLDVGMRKVYALNRQICVVKLPFVFSALKDIMEKEHEEAIFAATEAFRSLIQTCVDEDLIKQGVDQIMMNTQKFEPTIIAKLSAIIESLLTYQYGAVWDMVFQVVSAMFDKLGYYSRKYPSYFMNGTLKNLAEMQKLSDDDFPYRKQLHECIGSALGAMGPEAFLSVLPLKLEADDLSEVNVWLFPIIKQYTVGAQLSFFRNTIFGAISMMRQRSLELEREGRIISARSVDALAYSLWSLLPSFCNYPSDTAESFKDMEEDLCTALREEHDVRGILCSALQILIHQNKNIRDGKDDLSDADISIAKQIALAQYTCDVANQNLRVLRSSSRKLLPVLSGILLDSAKDDGGCLQSTISDFASLAAEDGSTRDVVSHRFLVTMKMLLNAPEHAGQVGRSRNSNAMLVDDSTNGKSSSIERARLFDLASSLLPGLKEKEVQVLFSAVQTALKDPDGSIQKKGYKVLSLLLQNGFPASSLDKLQELMIELLPSCHFSAKHHRLDCLYFLIVDVSKGVSEQRRHNILTSFLTEIILALKEANKKTRNRAYDLLVQIGHAYGDEESGGKREDLYKLFNMVAGGLVGEAPHMVSAAMKGLARLAYEFSDLISSAFTLLPSTLLLLQRKNREIIKANLGLVKVLVAKSQADGLLIHLGSIVEGLIRWQDDSKSHFKAKVKNLLEMLVKKCGMEAVKRVMPGEHMKLLTNIRKCSCTQIKERRERKLATNSEENKSRLSRATTSRLSRWNHTRIFSDSDDEEMDDSSKALSQLKSKASALRSKRKRTSDKSLTEDLFSQLEDEPLDLLDRNKTRASLRSSELEKRKYELDDEPEIDEEGRMIIHEGEKPKKGKLEASETDSKSEAGSRASAAKSSRTMQQKRRKTSESGWSYTGKEYGSKKAAGDVKRKGKLEPYAYWPLDRKMMSRRPEQRAAARRGMSSVVRMTKKLEGKSASGALSMNLGRKKKSFKRNSSS
ncbi:RRP12-like protein [Linum perenne]